MRQRDDFQLFRRKTKQRKNGKPVFVWYYRLWNGTRRTTARSTGQTSSSAAETWLKERLKAGTLQRGSDPLFEDYTASWWKWGECPYVLRRLARGRTIGRTYVEICRGYLDNHIMPALGELRISEITTETIEQLVMDLSEKESHRGGPLCPTTVNQILACLKIIFSESVRLGRLAVDPTRTVEPLEERPRERSFLAPGEVRKLFNLRTIKKVWDGDRRQYTINLLAASTGMRLGECQALQNRFVFNGYVQVEHGWTRFGLKEPKRGSKRVIPLPSKTQLRLCELMQLSPYQDPEDLIFWGEARDRPLSQNYILDHLYTALEEIGVSPEERMRRNISFHGWRHFFNSFLRGKVADVKLQKLTGHRTQEMLENYTHFSIGDYKDVLAVQEKMIG